MKKKTKKTFKTKYSGSSKTILAIYLIIEPSDTVRADGWNVRPCGSGHVAFSYVLLVSSTRADVWLRTYIPACTENVCV